MPSSGTYRLAIVTWEPSWHHPKLYRSIAESGHVDPTVYFLSRGSAETRFSTPGGAPAQALLEGYRHAFLRNLSPRKSKFNATRIGSYVNPSIVRVLARGRFDALLLDGWNDVSFWLAAAAARRFAVPYLVCGDASPLAELGKRFPLRVARRTFLQHWFLAGASGALYRCEMNRRFYEAYGVLAKKSFFYPFPVDLNTYRQLDLRYRTERLELRKSLSIRPGAFAILFVGRFAPEKRVFDLIHAYSKLDLQRKQLFLVGDGPLRRQVESGIVRENAAEVRLTGFLQRDVILKYYAACDALVLPSESETHGDVVMEGMCFGLPPVVSDRVGAAYDAVRDGWNGYVYPCSSQDDLSKRLAMLAADEPARLKFGERCRRAVASWGYEAAVGGVVAALNSIVGKQAVDAGL